MTTTTHHSSFPPFLFDLNKDYDHNQQMFIMSNPPLQLAPLPSSSNSLFAYPIFTSNPPCELKPSSHQHEGKFYVNIHGGSSYDTNHTPKDANSASNVSVKNTIISDQTSRIKRFEDDQRNIPSTQVLNSNRNSYMINSDSSIRVCADCHTTKTPLWRSGPRGPKSLCNACGIRQRKARRAAMVASSGTIMAPNNKPTMKNNAIKNKEKQFHHVNNYKSHQLPLKKRCKFKSKAKVQLMDKKKKNQLRFEDLMTILDKNSAFQRVFNQDEKEGAMLLMALSYGLVFGS